MSLFGHFDNVEMIMFVTVKLSSYAGNPPVYKCVLFMATSAARGESRPVYRGVYAVEIYNE